MPLPVKLSRPSGDTFLEKFGRVSAPTISSHDTYNKGGFSVYITTRNKGFFGTLKETFLDISDFVVSIEYSYDFKTPYSTFKIVLYDSTALSPFLSAGNWIVVYGPRWNNTDILIGGELDVDSNLSAGRGDFSNLSIAEEKSLFTEIDRGQITNIEKRVGDTELVKVTVKDPTWILHKNKLPVRLPGGTATERLRFLSTKMNIPLYEPLLETSHILGASRGGQNTVWEDIYLDLGETNLIEGKRYVLRQRRGLFFLQEITDQTFMWAFEVGHNLISLSLQQSIEDYYNRIYVLRNENSELDSLGGSNASSLELPYTGFAVADDVDLQRFGEHTLVVNENQSEKTPTAQIQAEELLKKFGKIQQEANLTSFSLTGIRWGDQILIYEPVLNMSGVFWVRSGNHQIIAGKATMNLQVEFDFIAPEEVRNLQADATSELLRAVGSALTSIEASP